MKKLYLVSLLALNLYLMIGCQTKKAFTLLEGMKAQTANEKQNKEIFRRYAEKKDKGKSLMEKWLAEMDDDIKWIIRQNLKKKRLAQMDAKWIKKWQNKTVK